MTSVAKWWGREGERRHDIKLLASVVLAQYAVDRKKEPTAERQKRTPQKY